jgi:hypothetical protein
MSSEEEIASWFEPSDAARTEAGLKLKTICQELRDLGVTRVAIAYDGYGDSGAIEKIQAFQDDQEVDCPEAISEQLEELAETWLPGGWEDNAGAYGELILDVAAQTLTRAHHWRIETTEYDEEEFSL